MPNPLIILGAGASYDFTHPSILGLSNHRERTTFPLTDDLISVVDRELEQLYDGFRTIRSRYAASVVSKKRSFEECLEGLNNNEQLGALLLYLGDYFLKKSFNEFVNLPNNFIALIDIINGSKIEGVTFVTFNYDLLLERAVDSSLKKFFNLEDYINNPVRIIKIHGSCDWYDLMPRYANDVYTTLKQHPEFLTRTNRLILTNRWLQQPDSGAEKYFKIPIISMPTTSTKSFACPSDHMQHLTNVLPETQKILIIGWKAADKFLLEKLKTIKKPVTLTVVSGAESDAKKIIDIIKQYVNIEREIPFDGGFSEFIDSDECNSFFKQV